MVYGGGRLSMQHCHLLCLLLDEKILPLFSGAVAVVVFVVRLNGGRRIQKKLGSEGEC